MLGHAGSVPEARFRRGLFVEHEAYEGALKAHAHMGKDKHSASSGAGVLEREARSELADAKGGFFESREAIEIAQERDVGREGFVVMAREPFDESIEGARGLWRVGWGVGHAWVFLQGER